MGSFALVWSVAGLLVSQMKAEDDAYMREDEANEIKKAKLIGLNAVRKKINSLKHNKEYEWKLLATSSGIANKLLQGHFDNFREFQSEVLQDGDNVNLNINLLYREVYNENKGDFINIIETIFINE